MKIITALALLHWTVLAGAGEPAVSAEDVRAHIETLTGFGGRLTGSESERKAAEYIQQQFRRIGLQPWQGDEYLDQFEFTAGTHLGANNALQVNGKTLKLDREYRPMVFSGQGEYAAAPVVFAGYGITLPEHFKDSEPYDAYTHLDVKDKWVLVLRFMPEDITPERRVEMNAFSSERAKALTARQLGAKGLLVVTGPNTEVKEELIPLKFDASTAQGSLPVISISRKVVKKWFKRADKDLNDLQKRLDAGDMVMGFELPDVQLSAAVELVQEKQQGVNVIGVLKGSGEQAAIAVGAHYDHLGHGEGASSLARSGEENQVHPGADDNASGVAGMLEMAEWLADLQRQGRFKPQRDVVFVAWSGEELGLLGSNDFVKQFGKNDISDHFMAYLNLDMVGRLRDAVVLQGTGSAKDWPGIIEKRNVPVGLNITLQQDAYLPTDAMSFYLFKIPILSAFTGSHSEYHSPRDTTDLINFQGNADIARLMALIARDLASRTTALVHQSMEREQQEGTRGGMRVYFGSIPDYASGDVKGVLLSGATAGGPAHQAGIRGGDVIIELAGTVIENIYDYTTVLQALKVGEPVTVKLRRGDEVLEVQVTPTSRQ